MDANEKANSLIENFWTWRLENNPEFATFSGFYDFDDKLEIFTLEALHDKKVQCKKFLDEALQILNERGVKKEMKENLDFLVNELKTYIIGSDAKGYFFPLNNLEGPHHEFGRLINAMPYNCIEDYNKLLNRYKEFPVQISQIIDLMREGIKQKMTYHEVSIAEIPEQLDQLDQLEALEKNPENCIFYKPFTTLPEFIPAEKRKSLVLEAVESISHNILPAFKVLKEFITQEYLPNARSDIAVTTLPNGVEFYQMCLDFHLDLRMTPVEIHAEGVKEVERITSEMEKVIESLELKMSVKEFSEKLRADESFYFKNREEVLEAYEGLIFNKIQPLMPKIVSKVPKGELKIQPTFSGPAAFYHAGTVDGRPGIFYINVKDVKDVHKYNMMTLALHEALPGHHLQMTYLQENKDLSVFRKYIEDRKYSEVPSRFPLYSAYGEGWGLYCEYLGHELKLYEDPYFHYGYLSFGMLRAVRLVVDTGMHAFNWSFEKAVNYTLDHTAISVARAESEIKRYITWPGQACAYKIGELKIKSLRKMAEQALGSKFNVQEFHNEILKHAGSLNVLEQKIIEYIKINA